MHVMQVSVVKRVRYILTICIVNNAIKQLYVHYLHYMHTQTIFISNTVIIFFRNLITLTISIVSFLRACNI